MYTDLSFEVDPTGDQTELTNLVESQLGLSIEPNMVRLIPPEEDGYVWSRIPEREHLFPKQLSKHSIGAYMELCREVGVSQGHSINKASVEDAKVASLPSNHLLMS